MSQTVPPIEERRKPGLSETLTAYPRSPINCQACGYTASRTETPTSTTGRHLQRWVEHDPDDRKTDVVVVLCNVCSDRLIDPHPRLYRPLELNEQHVGTHAQLCMGCRWRDGLTCNSPLRMARGGPGLRMEQGKPSTGFICVRGPKRKGSGVFKMWPPVTGCPGREEIAPGLGL